MQFPDNIAHQIHIMASSCPVMTDGTGHPLVQGLVNDRHRQHPVLPLIDIRMLRHHPVPVKSVYDHIHILRLGIIADHRHGIAVRLDAFIKQFHLRRRHRIGIVSIGPDLFQRNRDHIVNGTFILHIPYPPDFCIFHGSDLLSSAAGGSCQTP